MIGAFIEAWAEFRVHKARVLLSLLGVAIAVAALASVVGVGAVATQAQTEQLERGGGRPATLVLQPPWSADGAQLDPAKLAGAFAQVVERYSITYAGGVTWADTRLQYPDGAESVTLTAVDPAYGVMHRIQVEHGGWFTERDAQRIAPALVVSDAIWQRLGAPDLRTHPTVTMLGRQPTTGVIVGVLPPDPYGPNFQAYILNAGYAAIAPPPGSGMAATPMYEFWVPLDLADALTERIRADVASALGDGWMVDVTRQDYLAWGTSDPLEPIRLILLIIAGVILLLGALSLVNIAFVTVKQRVREIGIRRAFGATAGRVFLAVMLESVVATLLAGVVGVALAVILVQNEWIRSYIAPGLEDAVPFPAEAAFIGLGAAVGVGALAGLLPALVAVRVKVIDAIRY
ncbi:MAG: ABC transporter permease [Microbacteriaceae bacterium]|nr:ABC transporter permease [Microbacteriaceae bacterium]